MKQLRKSWTDFKDIVDNGATFIEHTLGSIYELYAEDGHLLYYCQVEDSTEKTDYEDNYQDLSSVMLHPADADGKHYTRAESRPIGTSTNFCIAGDISTEIGGDDKWFFDWNNTDNDVASPPTGYKQKKITFSFIDDVWLKEGTIYWENMPFGSFIDLGFATPNYGYYYANSGANAGTLVQNTSGSDLIIHRFSTTPLMGDCPMGDELNTEAASDRPIPTTAIGTILVTVPSSVGTDARCAVTMELYRERSIILT